MSIDIQLLLEQGESQTVEFKEVIKHPTILARYLSAFSNTDGGSILVGVREPNHIIGTSEEKLRNLFNAAIKRTTGPIKAEIEFKELNGKKIGVIHVHRSNELIGSADGIFKREGESTIALSAENITKMVHKSPDIESSLSTLSETISRQSQEISKISEELQKLNSWKRKLLWLLLGAAAGAFAKSGLAYFQPMLINIVG